MNRQKNKKEIGNLWITIYRSKKIWDCRIRRKMVYYYDELIRKGLQNV